MGTRVYIGRLSGRVRERELERFFKNYGRIREVILKNGYGFVEFEDYRDADDAAYECNGKELGGDRITVELARGTPRGRDRAGWRGPPSGSYAPPPPRYSERTRKPQRTEYRLVVENLSSRISWQDLKDFMRQAGEVTYCDSYPSRNEGIVEFASKKDMRHAMEKFEGHELKGRKIRLKEERPMRRSRSVSNSRRRRTRSRSVSRRRSVSRSRSASLSKSRSRSVKRSRSDSRERSKTPDKRKKSVSGSPRRSESGSPPPAKDSVKKESKSPVPRKRSYSRSPSGSPSRRSQRSSGSPPAKAVKEENGRNSESDN